MKCGKFHQGHLFSSVLPISVNFQIVELLITKILSDPAECHQIIGRDQQPIFARIEF